MLLFFAEYLQQFASGFNLFQYITFRAILGALTALAVCFLVGPVMIRRLSAYNIGQPAGTRTPEAHLLKAGTPTMGGALILVAILLSTLLWADLRNRYVWIALVCTLGFGLIGWVDDYRKLVIKDDSGLAARWKFFWQSLVGGWLQVMQKPFRSLASLASQ